MVLYSFIPPRVRVRVYDNSTLSALVWLFQHHLSLGQLTIKMKIMASLFMIRKRGSKHINYAGDAAISAETERDFKLTLGRKL